MSILSKKPRHEVISVRLNEDRLKLLERYQKLLTDQLGRPVSLAEAAFLVIEERVVGMDREASRHEMLETPTASLYRIRKRWESQHTLTSPEWDVLAEYMLVGTEEESQQPPLLRPAIPSKESYLALLDAFEAVYQSRKEHATEHAWDYFGGLDGYSTKVKLSDNDAEQRHQAVLKQIAYRKELLRPEVKWERPGNVGRCLLTAIRDEGVESTRLDQILAPYWPTLWGLAARGHWIRHDRQPVRKAGANEDDFRRRISLPDAIKAGDLRVSFVPSGGTEFATNIDFGAARRFSCLITRYPELAEFRAMLEGLPPKQPWMGRHFFAEVSKEKGPTKCTLWLNRNEVGIDFSESEWNALRDLFRQAWENPELQRWLQEFRQEYGEQD